MIDPNKNSPNIPRFSYSKANAESQPISNDPREQQLSAIVELGRLHAAQGRSRNGQRNFSRGERYKVKKAVSEKITNTIEAIKKFTDPNNKAAVSMAIAELIDPIILSLNKNPQFKSVIEETILKFYKSHHGNSTEDQSIKDRVLSELIWAGTSSGNRSIFNFLDSNKKSQHPERRQILLKLISDARRFGFLDAKKDLPRLMKSYVDFSITRSYEATNYNSIKNLQKTFDLKNTDQIFKTIINLQEEELEDLNRNINEAIVMNDAIDDDYGGSILLRARYEESEANSGNNENNNLVINIKNNLERLDVYSKLALSNLYLKLSRSQEISETDIKKVFELFSFDRDMIETYRNLDYDDSFLYDYPKINPLLDFIEGLSKLNLAPNLLNTIIEELENYMMNYQDHSFQKNLELKKVFETLSTLQKDEDKLKDFCLEYIKAPSLSYDLRAELISPLLQSRKFYDYLASEIRENTKGSENLDILLRIEADDYKTQLINSDTIKRQDYNAIQELLRCRDLEVEHLIDGIKNYQDHIDYYGPSEAKYYEASVLDLIAKEALSHGDLRDAKLNPSAFKLAKFLIANSKESNPIKLVPDGDCIRFIQECARVAKEQTS
jgi:hypothetical protein